MCLLFYRQQPEHTYRKLSLPVLKINIIFYIFFCVRGGLGGSILSIMTVRLSPPSIVKKYIDTHMISNTSVYMIETVPGKF